MKIVPFEPAHLRAVLPQAARNSVGSVFEAIDAAQLAVPEMSFSALDGDQVLGCAGIVQLWPGVGQAWAVLSERALAQPVTLTRTAWRELDRAARRSGFARIQATVADGHGAGARWLAFLGFEVEGLLVNYGPGGQGDYWIYGRTI